MAALKSRLDLLEKKRAFLVGIYTSSELKGVSLEHLDELKELCSTAGIEVVNSISAPLRKIEAATYLGKGKVEEIRLAAEAIEADVVVFDEEISPQQQRNLEKLLMRVVVDRTELILAVFSQRAHTREARYQVELARYQYELPRLKRLWTHLSRQSTGGGGYLKGEGEKQIEIDRRIVRREVTLLREKIEEVRKHRDIQRHKRERFHIPIFAIIGYTNAGKSTLLNALTDADVPVEDKLFATLDPTARKFTLPNKQEIILVDTVGFIRKLPHTLVAAFKSTLEEASFANILLHVVDASSPYALEHVDATMEVLKELNIVDRPIITCLNKIDLCTDPTMLLKLKIKCVKAIEVSALHKTGFQKLFNYMIKEMSTLRKTFKLRIPQSEYSIVSELMKEGKVISRDYEENDIILEVEGPSSWEDKKNLKNLFI